MHLLCGNCIFQHYCLQQWFPTFAPGITNALWIFKKCSQKKFRLYLTKTLFMVKFGNLISSLHCIIFLSICFVLYNGVCFYLPIYSTILSSISSCTTFSSFTICGATVLVEWLSPGQCYVILRFSFSDVIVSQKGSNEDRKLHFFGW